MYIIVGLGNPGKEYENTRHNVGFRMIDHIADAIGTDISEKKHKALVGKGVLDGNKVILVKPQTYMNLSGDSARQVLDYYKEDDSNLIVIYDDISLDVGRIRVRGKGSAGGHNGIKSIISCLGHDSFLRIKVGVGDKPKGYDLADYVLGHFSKEDAACIDSEAEKVKEAVSVLMNEGIDKAMNRFNG